MALLLLLLLLLSGVTPALPLKAATASSPQNLQVSQQQLPQTSLGNVGIPLLDGLAGVASSALQHLTWLGWGSFPYEIGVLENAFNKGSQAETAPSAPSMMAGSGNVANAAPTNSCGLTPTPGMTFNPLHGTAVITGSNVVVLLEGGSGTVDASQATNTAICKLAPGNDQILFGPGNDGIYSYGGNNQITFPASSATDTLIAVQGNSVIADGGGSSYVSLGSGNSQLTLTGSGSSYVTSGDGNNQIKITAGSDTMALGNGNNQVTVSGGGNSIVTVGNGNNEVTIQGGSNTVYAGSSNNQITIQGNGNNQVVVGKGNNHVATGTGNDVITVGDGNNQVNAGGGNDYCYYGTGHDQITNCQHQQKVVATGIALECLPSSISASAASTCTATLSGYAGSVAGQAIAFTQVGTGMVLPASATCSLSPVGVCGVALTGQIAGGVIVEALYAGDSQNGASLATFALMVTGTPVLVQPVIQWFPQSATFVAREGLPLGETFTSSQSYQNANLVVSGPISELISGLRRDFPSVSAEQGYSVEGSITIPLHAPSGWYNGSLSVDVAGRSVPGVLSLNIFVPRAQTVQVTTPAESATYAITRAYSPFFANTYDVTEYLYLPNGTAFPFRTLYDSTNSSGLAAQQAAALPTAPTSAQDATRYFFTYHFQDTSPSNYGSDLASAAKALRSTQGNPLIIRNDITWKSVDQGSLKCVVPNPHGGCVREAWVHTGWDFSSVDQAFGVATSAGAKFLPILGTHSPPDGLNQWSYQVEANYFIGNVTQYVESKYSGMVAGWQVSNEPNLMGQKCVYYPLLIPGCTIDWSGEASILATFVRTVKANDPTHEPVAITMYVAPPLALVTVTGQNSDPWSNIFKANSQSAQQLSSVLDTMGVDIYPDQWLSTQSGTQGFASAVQQTVRDVANAQQPSVGFRGNWGVFEMPAGPRFLGAQQIVQPNEVGQWINISKAASPPPAMIGLFQVRGCGIEGLSQLPPADGSAECSIDILPPPLGGTYGGLSYGLVDYDIGAVRLDYLNAIRAAVAVSEPIALTGSPAGAPPAVWSVRGCESSQSTITGDGSTHFVSADPLCTMTMSYANSGDTRYVMGGGASSFSVTTCDIGICPVSTNAYYYQDQVTASYSVSGGGSPAAPTLSGTQFGLSYGAALTTTASTYWLDHSTPWSATNPLGGSTSTERWQTGAATAGTSFGGLIIAPQYLHQFTVNFSVSPPSAGTTNPSGSNVWETAGADIQIAAISGNGNSFVRWISSGTITFADTAMPSTTMLVGSAGTVTAMFTAYSSGPVTQPIKATFKNTQGGSGQTIAVTGCSPSPPAFPGDGSLNLVAMAPNCKFSLTLPAGYQWEGGGSSTSCSSGICSEFDAVYEQTPVTHLPAVNHTTNGLSSNGGTTMATLTVDTTGDTILVLVSIRDGGLLITNPPAVSGITDTFNDVFVKQVAISALVGLNCSNGECYDSEVWSAQALNHGSDTIVVTDSAYGTYTSSLISTLDVTGVSPTASGTATAFCNTSSSCLSGTAINTATSNTFVPGSLEAAATAMPAGGNPPIAGTGYTAVGSVAGTGTTEYSVTSTSPTNYPFTKDGGGGGQTYWTDAGAVFAPISAQPHAAAVVVGQPDFVSNNCNVTGSSSAVSSTTLCVPWGLVFDPSGNLWVADSSNNRVLEFPLVSGSISNTASLVIGQPDFTSNAWGASEGSLNYPEGIAFDSHGNMWVADHANNRILEFLAPFTTGEAASVTVGSSSNCSISSTTLCLPSDIAFDSSGDLWVADAGNNRVLEYAASSLSTNGAAASNVIGQPDFTTGFQRCAPVSATALCTPRGLAFDSSGNLWVADNYNNRVLEFPLVSGSISNTASLVIGQPDFTSNSCGVTQTIMCRPSDVKLDSAGNLWVTNSAGGGEGGPPPQARTLEFRAPLSTGEAASLVFGQPDFTSSGCNSGSAGECDPVRLTFDAAGNLWVADTDNSRVLEYALLRPTAAQPIEAALASGGSQQTGVRLQSGSSTSPGKRSPF